MSLNEKMINELVSVPSLSATAYQARFLIQELKYINDEEYPTEACQIRNVFLCITDYILQELWELYDPNEPLKPPGDANFSRIRSLGRILHEIYSLIRYLKASNPRQTPPAIQVALTQLTNLYFPIHETGEPVCLIRPQWKYNLTCVLINWMLKGFLSQSVLDPFGKLMIKNPNELLPALWKNWLEKMTKDERKTLEEKSLLNFPSQQAILSFAGLDTQDTLCYPLLAHELGHFIDYSYETPLHLQDLLKKNYEVRSDEIVAIMESDPATKNDLQKIEEIRNYLLKEVISVSIRELLADLLATRMLGFSFFVAEAEFLKTLSDWSQPLILSSGYPGIKFRLSVILDHLFADDFPGNILKFLEETSGQQREIANQLLTYLENWKKFLKYQTIPEEGLLDDSRDVKNSHTVQYKLHKLAEKTVLKTVKNLNEVAKKVIPDDRCACLTNRFYDRILNLVNDLPPIFTDEKGDCLAEIMSASWAYQLIYGEEREISEKNIKGKFDEYNKTCRLILKAIELIPVSQLDSPMVVSNNEEKENTTNYEYNTSPGVLSAPYINKRIKLSVNHPSRLTVIPFNPRNIQAASLDVRLGNWFVVTKRTRLRSVLLGKESEEQLLLHIGKEEVFVPNGKTFLIHPSDFVLGATLEFLALPDDLSAFVEGRSGLGRKGLIIATATQIAPGFHGVIVLELSNTGTVPLEVTPGMPIAQLVFQTLTDHVPKNLLYRGKFHCQIKP